MKILLYGIAGLLGLAVFVFLSQLIASETGEVVVLESRGTEGVEETRLWVVDLDGVQYLRAHSASRWYQRLVATPEAAVTRAEETARYQTETRMDVVDELNRLMREKYGWRDVYIALLVGGREDAVPVALVPAG